MFPITEISEPPYDWCSLHLSCVNGSGMLEAITFSVCGNQNRCFAPRRIHKVVSFDELYMILDPVEMKPHSMIRVLYKLAVNRVFYGSLLDVEFKPFYFGKNVSSNSIWMSELVLHCSVFFHLSLIPSDVIASSQCCLHIFGGVNVKESPWDCQSCPDRSNLSEIPNEKTWHPPKSDEVTEVMSFRSLDSCAMCAGA